MPVEQGRSLMCFSATASFVAAGLTGTIGIVSLMRVNQPRERLLAATPIFFAIQQSIEGLQWLQLSVAPAGPVSSDLTLLFLVFAQVFWPVHVPFAVLRVEPNARRRDMISACLVAGVCVAIWLLWSILSRPHGAMIVDGHVVYVPEYQPSEAVTAAYVAATCLSPMLSSQRTVAALGAIILVGSVVAYVSYWEAFSSVWCFFAAVASTVILLHFEQSRRRRPRPVAAASVPPAIRRSP
jgi:hypothetical protein